MDEINYEVARVLEDLRDTVPMSNRQASALNRAIDVLKGNADDDFVLEDDDEDEGED